MSWDMSYRQISLGTLKLTAEEGMRLRAGACKPVGFIYLEHGMDPITSLLTRNSFGRMIKEMGLTRVILYRLL